MHLALSAHEGACLRLNARDTVQQLKLANLRTRSLTRRQRHCVAYSGISSSDYCSRAVTRGCLGAAVLSSSFLAGAALAELDVPPVIQQQQQQQQQAQAQPSAPSNLAEQPSAPPLTDAQPQVASGAPLGPAAAQPGSRKTAEVLRAEVDALLKQPPPAIPPATGDIIGSEKAATETAKRDVEALQQSTEEERKKAEEKKSRGRKKGRIRELEEIRAELAESELVLLGKERELLERDQTVQVLREELEIERKLRGLLTKDKQKAEEEAALAIGLCRSIP